MAAPEFYTVEEALELLRLRREELERLVSEGKIRAVTQGDTFKLSRPDVDVYRSRVEAHVARILAQDGSRDHREREPEDRPIAAPPRILVGESRAPRSSRGPSWPWVVFGLPLALIGGCVVLVAISYSRQVPHEHSSTPSTVQDDRDNKACADAIQRVQQFHPQNGDTTLLKGITTLIKISEADGSKIHIGGWSVEGQGRYCLVTFKFDEWGHIKEMQWLLDPVTGAVHPENDLAITTTNAIW